MKKSEDQLYSVYDLSIRREVSLSITFKHLSWQDYSSLNVRTSLAEHIFIKGWSLQNWKKY